MVVSIIVLVAFIGLGNLTNKTEKFGVLNMISSYFGASIYAFKNYINHTYSYVSPYWGFNTLPIVNTLRGIFGAYVAVQDTYYFPALIIPTKVSGVVSTTNLYTCLTKPMTDFGYNGMLIFYLLLGLAYASYYYHVIRRGNNAIQIILLGYAMMPVFCASAEYAFGSFLFAPNAIYQIIYLFIFLKILSKKSVEKDSFVDKEKIV